jgi:hypothetical protein
MVAIIIIIKMSNTRAQSISCVNDAVVMIVSDEVEMVGRVMLRQVLEFLYVELCQRHVVKRVKERCEGCEMNSPSQGDHDCCMMSEREQWDCHYDDAKGLIDLEMIRDLCVQFTRLIDIPMTSEWDDFIFNLSNINSSVARMIASEMLSPVECEVAIIDFVNNVCETMQNVSEWSPESFV